MKIQPHPRLHGIMIGDEVYSYHYHLAARVADIFPAAVCVRIDVLTTETPMELSHTPQLWRADEIENLSVCRYCGARDEVRVVRENGIPFRVCSRCVPVEGEL
ncbi:hypothetical protein [uncultured Chloroflexus sp.]|uniref:hypothetical protein n=1 Tax=uncultured Chloroflexus sp. TaxID=214040 RepID=UPI0026289517|nr:hypothetical protein [uncultured Chloroflexus sp.]